MSFCLSRLLYPLRSNIQTTVSILEENDQRNGKVLIFLLFWGAYFVTVIGQIRRQFNPLYTVSPTRKVKA